mgnify:CR=1 FL=1
MEESRVFSLNGVSLETVVKSVETFLRDEKGMEIQSAPVEHGCVIQATQKKDTLKMLVGMRLATTVQLVVSGENLNVMIGEGQWADKLGAGAVGLFLAWPLAVTAGIGAYQQKKLPEDVLNVISRTLMSPGQFAPRETAGGMMTGAVGNVGTGVAAGGTVGSETAVIGVTANGTVESGTAGTDGGETGETATEKAQVCPQCHAPVQAGAKFCSNCGAKLIQVCPECGKVVAPGSKFCSECGCALK